MKPRTLLMVVGASALMTVCACARRAPDGGPWPAAASPGPLRNDRFGISGGTAGREAQQPLRDLGVGWIRIPVRWDEIEPRPGAYNWGVVERAVAEQARAYPGMHVLVTLRAINSWTGGPRPAGASPKATLPPRDLEAYYRFVHGMAERGRGVVECWQIENEEDSQSWWAGTPEQYLALLHTAHRAIRAADPDAKIMLGGLTSELTTVATLDARGVKPEEIARQFGAKGPMDPRLVAWFRGQVALLDRVLAGAGEEIDVVDLHVYNDYPTIPWRVQWLRDRMRAHGYEKPIWATEVGGPDTAVEPYSEQAQAGQVIKRMALLLDSGVAKVFWLGLLEMEGQGERFNHLGLVTRGGMRKPAFFAYQGLIREVDDLPVTDLQVPHGYGFRFGQGAAARWVLWGEPKASYRLATGLPAVRVVSVSGRAQVLETKEESVLLSLTESPLLVAGAPTPGTSVPPTRTSPSRRLPRAGRAGPR